MPDERLVFDPHPVIVSKQALASGGEWVIAGRDINYTKSVEFIAGLFGGSAKIDYEIRNEDTEEVIMSNEVYDKTGQGFVGFEPTIPLFSDNSTQLRLINNNSEADFMLFGNRLGD